MSTSYNGWPGIPSPSDPRLTVIEPVPGRKFRVRKGAVATVFDWLIRRFHHEVEPIDTGVLDDWSYNYRKVVGGSSLSNHASATAVDLNATRHPFNTRATSNFTASQITAIRRILADARVNGQDVIRWLDVHDPMHFEVNYTSRGGSVANVEALAARIVGAATVPAPIDPRAPRHIDPFNPSTELVRITQRIVGVKVDGERGPKSRAATRTHQRALGIKNPDSLFGPIHARAFLLAEPNMYRAKPDGQMNAAAVELLHYIAGLPTDDSFGPGLESAIKGMQVWAGLYPDGNAGDATKRAIVR